MNFVFQAAACAGCPNQAICASAGPAAPDPDVDLIARNLDAVKNIVLVLSGKVKPLFPYVTKSATFDVGRRWKEYSDSHFGAVFCHQGGFDSGGA